MNKGVQPDLWPDPGMTPNRGSTNLKLKAWAPHQWRVAADWQDLVSAFFASAPGRGLGRALTESLAAGAVIYPPEPLRALALTPRHQVRVVILGQDPYHGPGQAEGLAFSVAPGVRCPPSLRNIFREIDRDVAAQEDLAPVLQTAAGAPQGRSAGSGSLVAWAQQGVLLLNTCLSVEQDRPASHAKLGWQVLTVEIIKAVIDLDSPVVFMLWGAHAQQFTALVDQFGHPSHSDSDSGRHLVLSANHPSPLAAMRPPKPFIGCGHFGRANAFLRSRHAPPIAWMT